MKFFDLENEYKGYKKFVINKKNVLKNKGKYILFVQKRNYDKYRGYYSIDSEVLTDLYYCTLHLDDYGQQIDKRDILECVIRK
jgi:hypothetical protein